MVCKNCGKELPEDSKFCLECGTKVKSPFSSSLFFKRFTSFFSNNVINEVNSIKKYKTFEWLFLLVIIVVSYAFALALNLGSIATSISGLIDWGIQQLLGDFYIIICGATEKLITAAFGFWGLFINSLFIAIISYLSLVLAFKVVVGCIYKKEISWKTSFNISVYVSLPMLIAHILSIVFSFFFVPVSLLFGLFGTLMTFILIYAAAESFSDGTKSLFWGVLLIIVFVTIISLIAFAIFVVLHFSGVGSRILNVFPSVFNKK